MRHALKQLEGQRRRFQGTFVRTGTKREFDNLNLKENTIISFDARTKSYYKGYQGHREDIDKPIKKDFRLANPTKVQIVPYNAEYEAKIRKMQQQVLEEEKICPCCKYPMDDFGNEREYDWRCQICGARISRECEN
jgi:hypothetical protein